MKIKFNIQFFAEGATEGASNVGKEPTAVEKNYIDVINKMKENMVLKSDYDEAINENRKLAEQLMRIPSPTEEAAAKAKPKVDVNKLKEKFSAATQMTNLEFVDTALQLRDALIEDGKPDPFLPVGRRISPTEDDIRKANKVAEAFEYCVDAAQGDPAIFNMELMRITRDS